MDRLSTLLERFRVHAHLFHSGALCGVVDFDAAPGRGFLHVLRRGDVVVRHAAGSGAPPCVELREPSLLFYPRALAHRFEHAPRAEADFTCATLDFQGGDTHPLARALPALVVLPLHHVEGLEQALGLLFAETTRVRCGQRLLADRLFEVVLIQLLRWLIDHPPTNSVGAGLLAGLADAHLARALVAMHDAPGEAWPLARMARCAGMSRSAFAARFKDVVGETPADYLTRWRLTIAQARLRDGHSVQAVADELGYAHASTLSRVFAHKLGTSPRQWLRVANVPNG